jgi:type VI protein secretion system component Hcp
MALGDNFMWFIDENHKEELPTGETNDWFFGDERKKAFELLSFQFGVSGAGKQTVETAGGDNTGADKSSSGKAQFNELEIRKPVDTASVKFYQSCSNGTEFDTAMIAVRMSAGIGYLLYMQYILRLVRITAITWSGASGDRRPEETVRMSFKAMGFRYVQQTETGDLGKQLEWMWTTVRQGGPGLDVGSGKSNPPFEKDMVVPKKTPPPLPPRPARPIK